MHYTRKSKLRLENYDYKDDDYYFITICTANMMNYFGYIDNGKMVLNKCGLIVKKQLNWLRQRYWYVDYDMYIIMPNHIHIIMIIDTVFVGVSRDLPVFQTRDRSRPVPTSIMGNKIKSISELICAFKTTSSKQIRSKLKHYDFAWQMSFYDRIIRNEKSLVKIQYYILNNPMKWDTDRNNPIF